jgi:transcription initiation factor TFIIB
MNSEDLMLRFCSNLQLPNYVQKAGIELVRRAKELGTLAGKSPISVAAACIYLVSYLYRQPKLTRDIAQVAGVSEVTIKSAYKSLYAERENLIDIDALRAGPSGEGLSFEDLVLP